MDPNANLREQLELADALRNDEGSSVWDRNNRADRLAELVVALDEWLEAGGFLPERWQR